VYGPGQENMLIPTIVNRMRSGAEITLARGIGIHLTPIYVGDVLAVIRALLCSRSEKVLRLFNVCGNESLGLNKIIQMLEFILNVNASIRIIEDKPKNFTGHNRKLRRLFPDLMYTDIETGLNKSFLQNYS
jgi:nucleoside-diphosphate-sugar epimerase